MARGISPKKMAILNRRKSVSEMYLRGITQWEIAAQLNCAQSTVSTDLKVLRKEWLASATMATGERIAQELAKIDKIEITYWEGWERSCKDAERVTTKEEIVPVSIVDGHATDTASVPTERNSIVEGQSGDPRFLEGIRWCISKRLEVLDCMPKKEEVPLNTPSITIISIGTPSAGMTDGLPEPIARRLAGPGASDNGSAADSGH